MTVASVAAGSTKFALLSEFALRQHTSHEAARSAGVGSSDYTRRTRELLSAGLVEYTGKQRNGANLIRITSEGRAACRALKRA